jgi:hypothetical protein
VWTEIALVVLDESTWNSGNSPRETLFGPAITNSSQRFFFLVCNQTTRKCSIEYCCRQSSEKTSDLIAKAI